MVGISFFNYHTSDLEGNSIYRKDLQTGAILRIDTNQDGQGGGNGQAPQVSADGQEVVFDSTANDLNSDSASSLTAQVYHKELRTGVVTLLSKATDGSLADCEAYMPSATASARYVAFYSCASNLDYLVDGNGSNGVVLLDLNTINLTSPTNQQKIVLQTAEDTNLTCSDVQASNSLPVTDINHTYPFGFVNFCFTTSQVSNMVSLIFVTDLTPSQVVARKYRAINQTYSTISNASITETSLNGQHALLLSYTINDGGPLDDDGVTNGAIIDPVGLGLVAGASTAGSTPLVPNTGLSPASPLAIIIGVGMIITSILSYRRYFQSTSK